MALFCCFVFWTSYFLPLSLQILSNEEKRSHYDHYGDAGESQGYQKQQQQREHRFRHFHENFYFDESFFQFPFNSERRDSIDEKYLLHFSHYVNEVVPDSFKKPYLIKITSDWCFSCIHIEPVWKEVVQELEGLGKSILFLGRHLYKRRWLLCLLNFLGYWREGRVSVISLQKFMVTGVFWGRIFRGEMDKPLSCYITNLKSVWSPDIYLRAWYRGETSELLVEQSSLKYQSSCW